MALSVLVLFIFFLLPFQAFSSCYVANCASNLPSGTCFQVNMPHGTYDIQACPSGQMCSINQMSSTLSYDFTKQGSCVSSDWLPNFKYPGELCSSGSECFSNICNRGSCQGLSSGATCDSSQDCNPGLVCLGVRTMFCTPQVSAGSACTLDVACSNDCLCYNGFCTVLFSLPDNSPFFSPVSQNALLLCENGYMAGNKCIGAPKNKNTPDFACYTNSDCKIVFPDQSTSTGNCYCGMNTYGVSYCVAQPGDPEFKSFKSAMISILSANNACHHDTSFTGRCPSLNQSKDFQTFINNYYIYIYRPLIIGVPDCVTSIMPFAQGYQYAGSSFSTGVSSSDKTVIIIIVVVVFAVLLAAGLVCFICVKKFSINERNQEILRGRFLREEMDELAIRDGRVIHQPEGLHAPMSKFLVGDILLDPKDKRFLKMGIPISTRVNPSTYQEEVDHEETVYETRTVSSIEQQVIEIKQGDIAEQESPSRLFIRSRPKSQVNS